MSILRIILAVAFLIAFFPVFFWLESWFKKLRPFDRKIALDVEQMRLSVATQNLELVPWNREEMELLSLREVEQKLKKGSTTTAEGVLRSIYQEPMVAYRYKKYSSSKEAVLYVCTSDRTYVYRFQKRGIQVYLNDEPYGVLRTDGVLYDHQKRAMARIEQKKGAFSTPIKVHNREVGSLSNPERNDQFNPKAFELLAPMQPDEEDAFLSLAMLELVMRQVSK